MNTVDRKAVRAGFAHQRAKLLFVSKTREAGPIADGPFNDKAAALKTRRQLVREGLIGFEPSDTLH